MMRKNKIENLSPSTWDFFLNRPIAILIYNKIDHDGMSTGRMEWCFRSDVPSPYFLLSILMKSKLMVIEIEF